MEWDVHDGGNSEDQIEMTKSPGIRRRRGRYVLQICAMLQRWMISEGEREQFRDQFLSYSIALKSMNVSNAVLVEMFVLKLWQLLSQKCNITMESSTATKKVISLKYKAISGYTCWIYHFQLWYTVFSFVFWIWVTFISKISKYHGQRAGVSGLRNSSRTQMHTRHKGRGCRVQKW